MPKTGTPLSATAVRNLKEPGKYYDLHGLFLRIEPTGSRRWVQRVSVAGRQREIGLGSADLVTLAEARELAVSNKKLARAGGDPIADKQERVAIPSLNEAIDKVLPKQNRKPKHRASLPYTDVSACLHVLKQSDAMLSTKLAIELLVLTATRSGEVRLANWSEIDFEARTWTIPAERMKMKEEHIIPLSDRALEVLQEATALGDDGLIFPGMRSGRPMSDMTMSKLVKELGYPVDIHGFRTTFRTWVQEQTNTAHEVAERALAHKIKDKSEAAYARSDLFEKRRKLMDSWASYLNNEPAMVVQLR